MRALGRKIGALVVVGAALCGCSVRYTDAQGNQRVIGLVDMTIAPAGDESTFAGNVVDITTIGVAIAQTEQGGHLSLGYTRDTSASLRDNAFVAGNPLTVRALLSRQTSADGKDGKGDPR